MGSLPIKINNILCKTNIENSGFNSYHHLYIINKGEDSETIIKVHGQGIFFDVTSFSEEIIEEVTKFINGYKVVRLSDNRYGYIREEDGKLLPYRYDVAGAFNEYGFAMVGKRGSVSWINKNFEFLSEGYEKMTLEGDINRFHGYDVVFDFNNGKIPLSKVGILDGNHNKIEYGLPENGDYRKVSYFSVEGNLKKFYGCNDVLKNYPKNKFKTGNDFNSQDYSIDDEMVLFADGYYCTASDVLRLCEEKGILQQIHKDIQKKFDNEKNKALVKKLRLDKKRY